MDQLVTILAITDRLRLTKHLKTKVKYLCLFLLNSSHVNQETNIFSVPLFPVTTQYPKFQTNNRSLTSPDLVSWHLKHKINKKYKKIHIIKGIWTVICSSYRYWSGWGESMENWEEISMLGVAVEGKKGLIGRECWGCWMRSQRRLWGI